MTSAKFSCSVLCAVMLLRFSGRFARRIGAGCAASGQQGYHCRQAAGLPARNPLFSGCAQRLSLPMRRRFITTSALPESKIAGRELRAITWFGAYLAANPSAPNAAAVKGEIDTLDVKGQSNVSRLIKSVQDAASQARDDQEFYLGQVAGLWAEAGDMATATKTIDRIQAAFRKNYARASVAEGLMRAGDLAGALKAAGQVQEPDTKSETLVTIATAQNRARDVAVRHSDAGACAEGGRSDQGRADETRSFGNHRARAGRFR